MNASEAPAASNGKILLADDEEILAKGLSMQLRYAGYSCETAATAEEALEKLGRDTFDGMIADIHMPGNVGLEMVEAAGKLRPGLPILLLTGRPSVDTAARSVRLPIYAYLIKPPNREELLSLLSQGVTEYRQRRALAASRERLQGLGREIAEIESSFCKGSGGGSEERMTSFLRLTLRNIAASIGDLERSTSWLNENSRSSTVIEKAELLSALRHTVGVLEKTKDSFKSKDLGSLRHQLEWLLNQQFPDGVPGSVKKPAGAVQ